MAYGVAITKHQEEIDFVCPHCHREVSGLQETQDIGEDADGKWHLQSTLCPSPSCKRLVLYLTKGEFTMTPTRSLEFHQDPVSKPRLIRPAFDTPRAIPDDAPSDIKEDYAEATAVLPISIKASAALSRRCLQLTLREVSSTRMKDEFEFSNANLVDEIKQVVEHGDIPSNIAKMLDTVRKVGAFGAHAIKSEHTGEITDVEPEEAKFNLQVIDKLLNYYFIELPEMERIIDEVDRKDNEAEKSKRSTKQVGWQYIEVASVF